jgi:hypothetical protein
MAMNKTRITNYIARTILFVLVVAVVWFIWQVRIVSERKAMKALLKERNLGVDGLPNFVAHGPLPLPWYRELLGDSTTAGMYLNRRLLSDDEIRRIQAAYPEVEFVIVDQP